MKVYIAAHDRWAACHVADAIRSAGLEVVSSWHAETFLPTEQVSIADRLRIAQRDVAEVKLADALVLISCQERVPGGKFVEAGVAIGQEKPVFILGHRENMLLWHPWCEQFDTVMSLVQRLLDWNHLHGCKD